MLVHIKRLLMGCVGSRGVDKVDSSGLAVIRGNITDADDLWSLMAQPHFNINQRDKHGRTPLILCVLHNMGIVHKLLMYKDIDVNIEDKTGKTALMYAIEGHMTIENIKLIRSIVMHVSYNVNRVHQLYSNPVCSCAVQSCTDLMYALINKRDDVVDLLLTLPNCDVNTNDSNGTTAMAHVFHRSNFYFESTLSLVHKLVKHSSYESNQYHDDGTLDITNAAKLPRTKPGRDELLSVLLSQPGTDINLRDHHGDTVYEMALANSDITLLDQLIRHPGLERSVINKIDLTGRHAAHLAILELTQPQDAPVVYDLIKLFVLNILKCPEFNVNGRDIQGKSALLYILNSAAMKPNDLVIPEEIITTIVKHPLYRVNQQYFDGYVDLLKACHKLPTLTAIKVIEELLQLEALNVNVADTKGTALRYLQSVYFALNNTNNHKLKPRVKQLILQILQHPTYQDKNQDLLWAAGNKYWGLVDNLLALPGINVNTTISTCTDIKISSLMGLSLETPHIQQQQPGCVKGMTLIHLACRYADKDSPAVTKLLKMEEINVNTVDSEGNSALMYAVKYQGPIVVQAILNHPSHCDLQIKNNKGQTVHDVVATLDDADIDVVALLKQEKDKGKVKSSTDTNRKASNKALPLSSSLKDRSKSFDVRRRSTVNFSSKNKKLVEFQAIIEENSDEDNSYDESEEELNLESMIRGSRRKSTMVITQTHQKKLIGNQKFLCENLSPNEVIKNLVKSQVICEEIAQDLTSARTRRHIVIKLLSVLMVSGTSTYLHFLSALRLTGQGYIAEEIENFDPVDVLF